MSAVLTDDVCEPNDESLNLEQSDRELHCTDYL